MKYIKRMAKYSLIALILTLIVGVVLFALGLDVGMQIVNYIGWFPGTAIILWVISVGAIANSLPIIILGFAIPFILLLGVFLLDKSKKLSRVLVYPILVANLVIYFTPIYSGAITLAVIASSYLAITLLADILPEY